MRMSELSQGCSISDAVQGRYEIWGGLVFWGLKGLGKKDRV